MPTAFRPGNAEYEPAKRNEKERSEQDEALPGLNKTYFLIGTRFIVFSRTLSLMSMMNVKMSMVICRRPIRK